MTDVFQEVEERLREDRLQTLWRQYGAWAIGAIGAIVLGAGGHSVWQSWTASQGASAGEQFLKLQEQAQADPAAAAAALETFARSAPAGYRTLAEMERAGALQAQGDLAGAQQALERAAKGAGPAPVKESAVLRAAYLAAETETLAQIEARLKPIVDARGPFSYLARELIGAEAYEAGDIPRARAEFTYLSAAFDAPEGVRQRAERFLAVVGPAPESTPESAPAAAPAPSGEKKK